MNYIKFCENLINNFGSRLKNGEISTIVLKRKDIDELAKSNPELKSMLDEVVKYTENTTMSIYSKAASNYEVARFNIRNSTCPVIQGVYSKDADGNVKYHISKLNKLVTGHKSADKTVEKSGIMLSNGEYISKEDLEHLANSDKNNKEIFKILGGISRGIYQRMLSSLGIKSSCSKAREVSKNINFEAFDDMVLRGKSIKEICETFGINQGQYLILRRKRNLETPNIKNIKNAASITKEDISNLIEQGLNRIEICEKLKINSTTLSRLEKEFGIQKKFEKSSQIIRSITKEQIQELEDAGYNSHQMAQYFGIGTSTLKTLRRKLGILSKQQKILDNISTVTGEQIQSRLDNGMKVDEICKDLGISRNTYKRMIVSENIVTKRALGKEKIKSLTKEKLISYIEKYDSVEEISRVLDISPTSIWRLIDRYNINIPNRNIKINIPRKQIISMLEQGLTRPQICEQLHISEGTYNNLLNRYGIMTDYKLGMQKANMVKKEDLIQKLQQGMNPNEIAEEYDIAVTTVQHLIDRYGIKTKIRESKRIIKDITKEKLEHAIQECSSSDEICQKLKISESVYFNLLNKYQIKTSYMAKKDYIESIKPEQFKELISKNLLIKDICKELNISISTYRKLLDKFNLNTQKSVGKIRETAINKYEDYSVEKLKDRLYEQFMSNDFLASNPRIEEFVEFIFNDNGYIEKNKDNFIKLLRTFDNVEKNLTDAETALKDKTVLHMLKDTERINLQILKNQLRFDNYLNEYSEIINNILPSNKKVGLSEICRKYLPRSIYDMDNKNSLQIFDVLKKTDFSSEKSLRETELKISRLDALFNEKNESLLSLANDYSLAECGEIVPEKAGQYIINHKILLGEKMVIPPHHKDFVNIILETQLPEKLKMNYLLKLDNFLGSSLPEEKYIDEFIGHFNQKDLIENRIIRKFLDSVYKNVNTNEVAYGSNNREQAVVFCKEAKSKIIEYYGYPNCLNYLQQFENALRTFAPAKGKAGIKAITGHNLYDMEVKINDKPRLLSSKNDYRFDIFSPNGLHSE